MAHAPCSLSKLKGEAGTLPRIRRAGLASLLLGLLLSGFARAETAGAQEQGDAAYQSALSALSARAWAEAELHFERVLMFMPEHAEARIQLAMLLAQRGKLEAASGFIESLMEDPRTPPAHRERLSEMLAQLKRGPSADMDRHGLRPRDDEAGGAIASEARPSIAVSAPAIIQARVSLGYSGNPYARADINSLTLTLPDGSTELPVSQNIHAAPLLINSLSYLAPNQCGFEAYDQRWATTEQQFANKLLLFCYGKWGGAKVQTFASSLRSVDGGGRTSTGVAWVLDSWRVTAQFFREPQLERQGYAFRVEHLQNSENGAQTLLYAEAEKATTGTPGYAKYGLLREYSLTSSTSLLAQILFQRDFAGYSALLDNGATRTLLFAELGLHKDWGSYAGWAVGSSLQTGRRWSNLALFGYKDTTAQLSLSRLF